MDLAYRTPTIDRRLGLLLTALVHVALIVGWHAVRTPPAPASVEEAPRSRLLWIPLPQRRPIPRDEEPVPQTKETTRPGLRLRPLPLPAVPQAIEAAPVTPITAPAVPAVPAAPATAAPAASADAPSAKQILERAKRDIGGIDNALRKENNPYIAAPLDSPQIRMRRKMEEAAALAPNRIWEAPKSEELVNNTGDGARRTRVVGALGTYCVTERATNTDVEMIEHHGKIRLTNCPSHEEPARQQTWRTLRD
jgi:hypothetical protein